MKSISQDADPIAEQGERPGRTGAPWRSTLSSSRARRKESSPTTSRFKRPLRRCSRQLDDPSAYNGFPVRTRAEEPGSAARMRVAGLATALAFAVSLARARSASHSDRRGRECGSPRRGRLGEFRSAGDCGDRPARRISSPYIKSRALHPRPRGNFGAQADVNEVAVALARTASFFSNNQAPLSSRTVRYISGIHFPPGIPYTGNGPLYGDREQQSRLFPST